MVPEYQDPDIREVIEGQYRVIYEVTASEIHVLAVIHGRSYCPTSLHGNQVRNKGVHPSRRSGVCRMEGHLAAAG